MPKIKEICKKLYCGKVYDLMIKNKHSYNVDGLAVHNSVGCSLIAFLLNLSEVNPMKYDLPFSRFLNEERIDLPDRMGMFA